MADKTTHGAPGPSPTTKDSILETGASVTQSFGPIQSICAHLNAFHVYSSDTSRVVEANHYCTHLSADVSLSLPLETTTSSDVPQSAEKERGLIIIHVLRCVNV
jgi:hypothetical protein